MPSSSRSSQRRIVPAVVLVIAATAGVATGAYWLGTQAPSESSAAPPSTAPTRSSNPARPTESGDSPQQVCANAARMWFASDTTTDPGPAAARSRAARRYGTEALQQSVRPHTSGHSPTWQQWARHDAVVDTHLQPYIGEKPPPAQPDQAYAAVTVQRTARGRDGWQHPLPTMTSYCTLTRTTGGAWRVAELHATMHGTGR